MTIKEELIAAALESWKGNLKDEAKQPEVMQRFCNELAKKYDELLTTDTEAVIGNSGMYFSTPTPEYQAYLDVCKNTGITSAVSVVGDTMIDLNNRSVLFADELGSRVVYQFEIGKIDNTPECQRRLLDVLSAKRRSSSEVHEIIVTDNRSNKRRK